VTLPRVALVIPGLGEGGGIPATGLYLERILRESGRYRPELVALPMASDDPSSVRLRAPASWLRGARVREGEWQGHRFRSVGAVGAELELLRYRARRPLTRLLQGYDAVQLVAGAPSWALAARGVGRPVALCVATLTAAERRELATRGSWLARSWRGAMLRASARLEPIALRHVDVVFVMNEWMLAHMRGLLGPSRVILAPPGVDTDRFRPPASARAAPGAIVSVGRFADPRKRVDLLFRAYRELDDRMPDPPRLRLAGYSEPTNADWKLAAELGIRARVDFLGALREAELVELYHGATLLALASDEEGFGLVVLEAMACGLPVVSTDCGGPRTSVVEGETGFLVPRGDARQLAARMHAILRDGALRERLGRAGRARAVARFSLPVTGRVYLDWYDRTLHPPASLAREARPR
jgi:glycosyltransferase involved in cell wall biosynthesis